MGIILAAARLARFRKSTDTTKFGPGPAGAGALDGRRAQAQAATAKRFEPAARAAGPVGDQRARWVRGYDSGNGPDISPIRAAAVDGPIGIGLSGGGIRAASVMLGAFQNKDFRERVLAKAGYLVSVSGGGYTAGAFVQALTAARPATGIAGEVLADPGKVFAEGTVEEDHIRRNASYISRNTGETVFVLGLLLQHLILNLVLLFGPAIILGVLAARFYEAVPITALDPILQDTKATLPPFPTISVAAWIAMAILAGLAALAWLLSQLAAAHSEDRSRASRWKLRRRSSWLTSALAVVFWTVVIVGAAVPAVIWAAAWVMRLAGFGGAVPASIGTVLLTYLSSLAALLWRKRANLKAAAESGALPAAVPRGFGQLVLVALALTALGIAWLLVFGGVAVTQLNPEHSDAAGMIWAGGLLVLVVLVGGFIDETTLSLHPFYRRRLARAFAVRAVRRKDGNKVVAERFDPNEHTTLSTYGLADPTIGVPFPEVIFAASATIGDGRTPPGSNRVSYTFSSQFVGGPDVGYYPTSKLEAQSPRRLRRDLTVQGAVALSGAALAASVGTQNTKWYETLFAVTGVRLGAWMPNPTFLTERDRQALRWHAPGLPRVRRMSFLLRELFGLHPHDAPLVQVTDGGFYDNLGLIELFRRRCTTIYCLDASGDNPPPASTLAEVVTLAYQELGVKVVLNDSPFEPASVTGSPAASADTRTSLNSRLFKSGVTTASFTYPPESGLEINRRTGTLVVAKASLWPELPYPLLAYAMRNPTFPNDSADQWFDDGQYGAYTALGRELGAASVAATEPKIEAAHGELPATETSP